MTGSAGLEFAEGLAELGGQVAVPTSLNVMSMDRERWSQWGQDPEFADRAPGVRAAIGKTDAYALISRSIAARPDDPAIVSLIEANLPR